MTLLRTPVAGCFLRTTGEYPKSLSTKNTISSSRIKTSLEHTVLSQRCMVARTRASSSSVPTPADVLGGGTAGTMQSGLEESRWLASFWNSGWVRRTSRNWVVRNLGRLVWNEGDQLNMYFAGARISNMLLPCSELLPHSSGDGGGGDIRAHRISRLGPFSLSSPEP